MLRMKLHAKFLVLVLGSLVLFFGILSYVVVQRQANLLAAKADEEQHLLAFTIFSDLKTSMLQGTPRSTLTLIDDIRGTSGVARMAVLRPDGTPAFGMPGEGAATPGIRDVVATGEEVSFMEGGEVPLHTVLLPLKNEQACRECHRGAGNILGVILISISREDALREIHRSTLHLVFFLVALMAMTGGVLYLAVRKAVLKPLATLFDGAERIGKGDFTRRISLTTGDELQDLAQAFNETAERLEESYEGLESRVRERTAELQSTMLDVRNKAARLYSYSRNMATISRLSTKIFEAELSRDELLDRFMRGVTRGLGYARTMLCLVDRKRIWLDVQRDTGLGDRLQFSGGSLLSTDPLITLVRKGTVEVRDDRAFDPASAGSRGAPPANGSPALYLIPLLNRTQDRTCWQITSCIKTDCPAYTRETTPCWLVDNTLCGNPLRESSSDKLAKCMTCQVFPVIGVLLVESGSRQEASHRRNIGVLRILGAEMAAALENHRLHEDNRLMVRELLELNRVTAAALADLSLDKALEIFTDSALKFSGSHACSFWLISPDGRELVRKAGGNVDVGEGPDLCPDHLPVDEGLIGRALSQQGNFVIDYDVARHDTTALGRTATAHGLSTLLAIALKGEGRAIGVFSVHKRGTMPFLDTEIAAFMLLANQAAMSINVCLMNEELKNQNLELGRQTNLLGGILSSMSSGIMLLDKNGVVSLVNEAGADILRTSREDLMNRELASIFPEASAFVKSPGGSNRGIDIRLADGTTVPVGFSSTYYYSSSDVQAGIIVVYRDLSEIKALQAELLNKERFAAMGRVVAGVAHEIRNPLFGISSVGQILEREACEPRAPGTDPRAALGNKKDEPAGGGAPPVWTADEAHPGALRPGEDPPGSNRHAPRGARSKGHPDRRRPAVRSVNGGSRLEPDPSGVSEPAQKRH